MREGGDYLQPPDAMDISECSGKEEFHVTFAFEELVDIEELIPGSSKETLRLFGHEGGEIDMHPKAGSREQYVPPRPTDMRHRDERFVHGKRLVWFPP